jgi:DNA-binding transcriptional LysR family regulator
VDRLDALRLFVRAAEMGSFSKAAAEANVGQPAASRTISALEERYGARLFNRTTRSLSLTEAGRSALEHARAVLEAADLLESAVRGVDREPVGLLRVSASIAFTRAELGPILPGFLARYPHVRVDLLGRDDRVDLVAEGVDVALRLGPLEDSSLRLKKIGDYQRIIVAAPELLDRVGAPEEPEDLKARPCIVFTSTPYSAVWPLLRGEERRDVEITGPVKSSNGEIVRDFACAGLGFAFAPDFLWKTPMEDGRLVRVLPDWAGPPLPLHALWSGRDLPRKARVFLEHVTPHLTLSSRTSVRVAA